MLLVFVRLVVFVPFAGGGGDDVDSFLRPPKPSHRLSGDAGAVVEGEVAAAAAGDSGAGTAAGAPPSLMLFSPSTVRAFFCCLLASRVLYELFADFCACTR